MFRRITILLAGFGLAAFALAGVPASADPSPVSSPIQAGNSATTVGNATFTRTTNGDGSETLTVDINVSGGISEDHLCLSQTAFTSRQSPGSCAYGHEHLGDVQSDQYVVNLGTAYLGKTIYVQLHVVTHGDTAFAGWHDGSPFYGNVAIDPNGPGVPAAPLLGSWAPVGLAAIFLGGIGAVVWRRRQRTTAE